MGKSISNLKGRFPIVGLTPDGISLNNSADVSVFFSIKMKEIFTISDTEYENQRRIFNNAISAMPDNIIFQKIDFFTESTYQPSVKGLMSRTMKANELHFAERPFISHKSYIGLTFLSSDKKKTPSNLNVFKTLKRLDYIDPLVNTALKYADVFKEIMKSIDTISLERMFEDEIIELFYRYCNLDFTLPPNSQANDISIKPSYIVVGNKLLGAMRIGEYSDMVYGSLPMKEGSVEVSMTHPLCLGLPKNHITSTIIRKENTRTVLGELMKKSSSCNMVPIPENMTIQENLNNFITQANNEKSDVIGMEYNIFYYALTAKDLEKTRNEIISQCSKINFKPLIHSGTTYSAWMSNLPGNTSDIYEFKTMLLPQAINLLNLESIYNNSVNGIKLCDKLTGVPVVVNIRDKALENKNFICVGPSGSGKSFFQNWLAHQLYYLREHVVVIETGRSFKKNCLSIKGSQHIEYSIDNPIEFNPFIISEFDFSIEAKDNNNVIFLSSLLFIIWGDEKRTKESEAVMNDLLFAYYRKKRKEAQESKAKEKSLPNFFDFYEYIDTYFQEVPGDEQWFSKASFKRVLSKFNKGGQYSNIFGTGNIDLLNCPFIVFELIEIKDNIEIIPIVTLIMIETIMEKFRKLVDFDKTIILDEAWNLLKGHNITKYIEYMYRTCRKHHGATGIITQNISEIQDSPIGSAMVGNTSTYFILDFSKATSFLPVLQSVFGFTDNDIKVLRSIENKPGYKEVMVKMNNTAKVYRTEVSDHARILFTSDEQESKQITGMLDKFGGNIDNAVDNYIETKSL